MMFFFTLFFACEEHEHDHEHKADTAAVADGEPNIDNGQTVYQGCMVCHAGNGIDITAESPDFTDEELAGIITEGIGSMTPQTHLTDEDVRDVIAYIRSQE